MFNRAIRFLLTHLLHVPGQPPPDEGPPPRPKPDGRPPDDLLGGTRVFKILRASYVIRTRGALPMYQELLRSQPDAWFTPEDPPALILFISHRWLTPTDPDPHGTQAASLRAFLGNLRDVAIGAASDAKERVARVPSLQVHGVFQAAYVLGFPLVIRHSGEDHWGTLVKQFRGSSNAQGVGDRLLERVGIWYDFACLPQSDPKTGVGRTEQEERIFLESLRQQHSLIQKSMVLTLRAEGDAYETGPGVPPSYRWCPLTPISKSCSEPI
jgi:hypothetical protein